VESTDQSAKEFVAVSEKIREKGENRSVVFGGWKKIKPRKKGGDQESGRYSVQSKYHRELCKPKWESGKQRSLRPGGQIAEGRGRVKTGTLLQVCLIQKRRKGEDRDCRPRIKRKMAGRTAQRRKNSVSSLVCASQPSGREVKLRARYRGRGGPKKKEGSYMRKDCKSQGVLKDSKKSKTRTTFLKRAATQGQKKERGRVGTSF